MAHDAVSEHPVAEHTAVAEYEPPEIEAVLTAEDLAREIQYAGVISQT